MDNRYEPLPNVETQYQKAQALIKEKYPDLRIIDTFRMIMGVYVAYSFIGDLWLRYKGLLSFEKEDVFTDYSSYLCSDPAAESDWKRCFCRYKNLVSHDDWISDKGFVNIRNKIYQELWFKNPAYQKIREKYTEEEWNDYQNSASLPFEEDSISSLEAFQILYLDTLLYHKLNTLEESFAITLLREMIEKPEEYVEEWRLWYKAILDTLIQYRVVRL